ncbi:MAG: DUF192 domain-containing protein [Candidatus Paceibacterota bacterium]
MIRKLKKEKKILYGSMAILFLVLGWYGYTCGIQKTCGNQTVERFVRHDMDIVAPRGTIATEVVDTSASRALGLSGRKGLAPNEGMLFVFDASGRYGFWMKDMLFPLDIIWINQSGVVVHIERDVTPESYTGSKENPKTFINTPDALYVLEINTGKAEEYGLYLGSKVKLEK